MSEQWNGYEPLEDDDYDHQDEDEEYGDAYDGDLEDEDYSIYNEELDDTHKFRIAMNVFDTASVFAGIVVIFALTTLIFSLLSWIRTDITHSFVILQNRIQ